MPAKLYINLSNLKYNIEQFKKRLLKKQELLVMVKADAYGAGIVDVTKFLEVNGISHFGVAYLKEAKLLRQCDVKSDIIVFSGLVKEEIQEAINIDAIYSVSNFEILDILNKEAKKACKKIKVELAIDTGMTRLGFNVDELETLKNKLEELDNIRVDGIYTHLSQADSSDEFTKKQIEVFNNCLEYFKAHKIEFRNVHLCNSAGILKYNEDKYNLVRLGIGAYGYSPDPSMEGDIDLKGIFKLTAPLCNIRNVQKGREVSYGGTFVTNKDTKIAVLQIGYADGLTRTLSNKYNRKYLYGYMYDRCNKYRCFIS